MTALTTTHLGLEVPARRPGFHPRLVLDDISFSARRGELVAIVGRSGSGKSTLLACLAGLDRPSRGSLAILGVDPSTVSRNRLARHRLQHVSVLLQDAPLVSALTCRENVLLPRQLQRRSNGAALRKEADSALSRVGMASAGDELPSALSGGEQQRVAVARMLATPAEIVLADEPTGALDRPNAATVFALLRARADAGSCVVLVTHDLEAASRADRVLVLSAGRLVADLGATEPTTLDQWIRGPVVPPALEAAKWTGIPRWA